MPRMRLLAAATVVLLAAGCSSGPSSSPSPTPAPEAPPSSAEATSASPSASAEPCPDGGYLVTALEGRGQASGVGKGSGGNITADFTSGTFTLSSDGSQPVQVAIGPVKAELHYNGEIAGTYAGDPSALVLTTTGAHGDVAIKGFGVSRSYSADDLAQQLIGQGATAQVTCDETAGTAVVLLPNASLTLIRRP